MLPLLHAEFKANICCNSDVMANSRLLKESVWEKLGTEELLSHWLVVMLNNRRVICLLGLRRFIFRTEASAERHLHVGDRWWSTRNDGKEKNERVRVRGSSLTLWTEVGPTGLIAINILESVDFFAVLNIERDQISALREKQLWIVGWKATIISTCVELRRKKINEKQVDCFLLLKP